LIEVDLALAEHGLVAWWKSWNGVPSRLSRYTLPRVEVTMEDYQP